MTSPSIKTTKKIELVEKSNRIYVLYPLITLVLLIICKPKFILRRENLHENPTKISYSKLLLWQLILCTPLIFYYIINY